MIHPHANPASVCGFVIDTIWNDLAQGLAGKVVDLDRLRLSLRRPLATAIVELADPFLLFGIDRDDRLALLLEGFGTPVDVLKLRIPIGVRAPL
jgi:hypothetical protein